MQKKRLTRREFISFAAVMSASTALAACSSPSSSNVPTASTSAPTAASLEPTAAAPSATEAVVVTASAPTPASIAKFNEAPTLAKLVEAGTIPPVDKRLPDKEDIRIAKTISEIGKYGGIQRGPAYGPKIGQLDTYSLRRQALLTWETDFKTISPNLLKSYSASEDYKTWTLVLRKGLKYSDGQPLTAEDFIFWYEDVLLNKELNPSVPVALMANNEVMKMTQVDDFTIQVDFTSPYPNFDLVLVRATDNIQNYFFLPKHYLQKWHIKYNEKANDVAKEEKYETWAQAFTAHADHYMSQTDPNAPDITPWIMTKIDDLGNKYYERNPYYWVVDEQGNQLPYIDQQIAVMVKDKDVRNLKLMNQEIDNAAENPLPLADYTLYKENEQKGNYTTYLFENTRGSDVGIALNMTHKDMVLRELFGDLRFRQALSLAINRQQINEVNAFGKGTVRQATIPPSVSYYEDWMGNNFIDYDVDKANGLLDEIGLKWNDDKSARLRSDGKPLEIVLETWEEFGPFAEMVAENWTVVGVKTTYKQDERTLWDQRQQANELDAMAYPYDSVAEPTLRASSMGRIRPGGDYAGVQWKLWFTSGGKQGIEPAQEFKDLYALCDQISTVKPGSDDYMKLGKDIATKYTNSLIAFGIYLAPRVVILSNNFGNTPTKGIYSNDYMFWDPYRGDQWYFKNV